MFKREDTLNTGETENSDEDEGLDEIDKQIINLPSLKNQAERIGQKLDLNRQ